MHKTTFYEFHMSSFVCAKDFVYSTIFMEYKVNQSKEIQERLKEIENILYDTDLLLHNDNAI